MTSSLSRTGLVNAAQLREITRGRLHSVQASVCIPGRVLAIGCFDFAKCPEREREQRTPRCLPRNLSPKGKLTSP